MLDAPVVELPDAETAELTKIAECIYRDVNIALANELARFAHGAGIEIDRVIEAANSEPLSQLHQPGVGVGGRCIPVYPYFLLAGSRRSPDHRAGSNRERRDAGLGRERVGERLGGLAGRNVLVLGLSYRADVRETSGSVALALIAELRAAGAQPLCLDSAYGDDEIRAAGAEPFENSDFDTVDAVILGLHGEFRQFPWNRLRSGTLVADGRNVLDPAVIRSAGLDYLGVGRLGRS